MGTDQKFSSDIVCCYLYVISKYGYPPPAEKADIYLEEMVTLGFSSIELEGIREENLLQMYDLRSDLNRKKEALHLEIPYFCVVLPGLSSPERREREKNLKLFEKGCRVASTLGSLGVLDNAPLPPYQFPADIPVVRHYNEAVLMSAKFPDNLNWKKYWNEMVGTYRQACDIAADYHLTYQMHPCLGVLSATTDAFLYFYEAVGRDNLRFNFDTANQYFLKDNLALSLYRLKDYIDYIHLSDTGGLRVEHLEPGRGVIRWEIFFETLERINFKGKIGLDIGGEESSLDDIDHTYQKSANWLKERWLGSV